jgi:hypothetical protein
LDPNLDVCMTASLTCPRHKHACVMSSSSRLDRQADLAGRPSYDVHPTISMTNRTKHIRVRYFFIKDRVSNGDITLKHCPTGEMIADHFTKPLQGALFHKFRAEIQGIPVDTNEAELGWDRMERSEGIKRADPSPHECVGPSGQDPRSKDSRLRRRYCTSWLYNRE